MFEEHVGKIFKEFRVPGAEKATGYLIHHFFQHWDAVVVGHGIVSSKGEQKVSVKPRSVEILKP